MNLLWLITHDPPWWVHKPLLPRCRQSSTWQRWSENPVDCMSWGSRTRIVTLIDWVSHRRMHQWTPDACQASIRTSLALWPCWEMNSIRVTKEQKINGEFAVKTQDSEWLSLPLEGIYDMPRGPRDHWYCFFTINSFNKRVGQAVADAFRAPCSMPGLYSSSQLLVGTLFSPPFMLSKTSLIHTTYQDSALLVENQLAYLRTNNACLYQDSTLHSHWGPTLHAYWDRLGTTTGK